MFAVYGYEEEDDEVGADLNGYVSPFGAVPAGCTDGCTDCEPCKIKKYVPFILVALGAWFLLT